MKYLQLANDLYAMIGQGQMLEAFEKYYHEDVVMIEADGKERVGKDANREFEKQFMASIAEMHDDGVYAITSNEETGTTMVETWMDTTFKDGNRMKMEEVCVQQWKGGLIIRERFYYNMGGEQ
jgi:ketosteroid isomerase-like protein